MDLSHAFSLRRWRSRFRTEDAVREAARQDGRAPDATVDEVGVPPINTGFDGRPIRSPVGNGHGTGGPSGWTGLSG